MRFRTHELKVGFELQHVQDLAGQEFTDKQMLIALSEIYTVSFRALVYSHAAFPEELAPPQAADCRTALDASPQTLKTKTLLVPLIGGIWPLIVGTRIYCGQKEGLGRLLCAWTLNAQSLKPTIQLKFLNHTH